MLLTIFPFVGIRVVCLNPASVAPAGMTAEPSTSRCEHQCPIAGRQRVAAANSPAHDAARASTERCLLVPDPGCGAVLDSIAFTLPAAVVLDAREPVVPLERRDHGSYAPPPLQRFTPPPRHV